MSFFKRDPLKKYSIQLTNFAQKSLMEDRYFQYHFLKNHVEIATFIFFCQHPNLSRLLNPQENCCAQDDPDSVIGIYIVYYIYKFQEK